MGQDLIQDSWYVQQEALQKKILKRMREYGIKPVFPGYSGMVPHDADEKLGLNLTKSDLWNGFTRPAFLQPTDVRFAEIADLYYQEQEKLFGKADYYSMDPFHEAENAASVDFDAGRESYYGGYEKSESESHLGSAGLDREPSSRDDKEYAEWRSADTGPVQ